MEINLEEAIKQIAEMMKKKNRPILVALDGRSGTGKSTMAKMIATQLGGVEIVSDDFWIGGSDQEWDARSPGQRADLAINWRRLRNEVLVPLLANKHAAWHPYDWKGKRELASHYIEKDPSPLIVLDGAYSTRPELVDIIDLAILVEVPSDVVRRKRLIDREGETYMENWHRRWDPAEDFYFSKIRPRESFDIVLVNN